MATANPVLPFDPVPTRAGQPATTDAPAEGITAQPMVELRNVTKRFGTFTAVQDVSLSIRAGEFITLLGPSGCGKTTLLRMLSGFESPTAGQVLLEGRDVTAQPPYRRDVNQVFQSYALFPHLSVSDNVAFGLRMKKVSRKEIKSRVAEAIALVSLDGLEGRKPHQLSGGQRQRVALARAIVNRPKVLLLDEPLSALDAKLRHAMQLELKHLQARLGITFVFVTHDQEEAMTMSDRIAVIHQGKVEQLGSVADVYHNPRTRFVAGFIGQANILEAQVLSRDGRTIRIKLGDGVELEIDEIAAAAPPDAESLLVSIRPEKIHLCRDGAGTTNQIAATVGEVIFKGATAELHLNTAAGLDLRALLANTTTAQRPFRQGEHVTCEVHPSDVVVLSDT